jgi:hypothetical protein
MATCKVLSKPDYELTLSSDEKEALEKFLGGNGADEHKRAGLDDVGSGLIYALYRTLNSC